MSNKWKRVEDMTQEELKEHIELFEKELPPLRKEINEMEDSTEKTNFDERVKKLENRLLELIEKFNSNIFSDIWQGTGNNELVKVTSKKGVRVDNFKNTGTIRKKDFEVEIKNFNEIEGLRTSTHKLLDILMLAYVEGNGKGNCVKISVKDFMELRGLKDKKAAKQQLDEDLETLYNISLSFKQKERGKVVAYGDARVLQDKSSKNGVIKATFGEKFSQAIEKYFVMPMPRPFLALNDKYNPNAYHLGRRIALHKNMNYGKDNADLISVETLLDACPNLAGHEEVYREEKSNYIQRIIEPFEHDMNALKETGILTWEYCYSKDKPLTIEEVNELNYEKFRKLLIKITWLVYPERAIKS